MSGKLTLAERFLEGFQLLKAAEKDIGHECLARMQALLYVFAGKFLNKPPCLSLISTTINETSQPISS